MACEGPICKFCDEVFHRRTVMRPEYWDYRDPTSKLLGWSCPYCLRSIDFCDTCGHLISGDEYKVIHDPDPQCVGYICSNCGNETEV